MGEVAAKKTIHTCIHPIQVTNNLPNELVFDKLTMVSKKKNGYLKFYEGFGYNLMT